jgi:hypothetical protein
VSAGALPVPAAGCAHAATHGHACTTPGADKHDHHPSCSSCAHVPTHPPTYPPTHPPTRPQSPYQCNLLIAGYDENAGASLYWLDYLATLHKVNTGGTGYGEASCVGRKKRHSMCASVWRRRRRARPGAAGVRRSAVDAVNGCQWPLTAGHSRRASIVLPHVLAPTHPQTGSYFALSLFDKMWHPDLTQDEAVAMMEVGAWCPVTGVGCCASQVGVHAWRLPRSCIARDTPACLTLPTTTHHATDRLASRR